MPGQTILLGEGNRYRHTDKVARRGTDVALLIFVFISVLGAVELLAHPGMSLNMVKPSSLTILVYDGWIAGTVLSVAMHLYPRLFSTPPMGRRAAMVGQAIWGLAVLFQVGCLLLNLADIAVLAKDLFGLTLVWHSVGFLGYLKQNRVPTEPLIKMSAQSQFAWQVACSTFGSSCMILSFYMSNHGMGKSTALHHLMLGGGGVLALMGVLWFAWIQIKLAIMPLR